MHQALAYRPTSSGHEGEPRKRKGYVQPSQKLFNAFGKWLDWRQAEFTDEEDYSKALSLMEGLSPSVEEVNTLIVPFEEHPDIALSGPFLSALYNKAPERVIICDFNVPVFCLGYKLNQDKMLVNRGNAGSFMGWKASGTVINYGDVYGMMSDDATGIIIAVRNPRGFGVLNKARLVIEEADCKEVPGLLDYMNELNERLDSEGEIPKIPDIEADLKRILNDAGRMEL